MTGKEPKMDIVERLRQRPYRMASEHEDQAKERRQAEREEGAAEIETLRAENEGAHMIIASERGEVLKLRAQVADTTAALNRLIAEARADEREKAASIAFERGEYRDEAIAELLRRGWIRPHADPTKGWVPVKT